MSKSLTMAALATATLFAFGSLAAPAQAKQPTRDRVVGGGYAAFESNGAPGDNSYWVFAKEKANGRPTGQWYADVVIEFPGFTFIFDALYSVDCIEVDDATGTAWIDGTVIESPNPDDIGVRATLWIRDGSASAGGVDMHAITPIAEGSEVNCKQRPEPDFMEAVQSGNYFVGRRHR